MPRRELNRKFLPPEVRAEFIDSVLTKAGIPYGECHCGCGRKTTIAERTNLERFRVAGEPIRFIKGHSRVKGSGPEYLVNPESGCWDWQRKCGRDGYGHAWCGERKQSMKAHRLYYERHVGPIPEGLHIDHKCQNVRCVNPEHLEPVTALENLRRSRHAKLSMDDARAIRLSPKTGVELAAEYGVGKSVISAIRRNRTWKEDPLAMPDDFAILNGFMANPKLARTMRVPPGREHKTPPVLAAPVG